MRFIPIVSVLVLSACATPADTKVGVVAEAQTICTGPDTVPGIDVSEWQGNIDWNAAAGSGIAFAITRINDGHHNDPTFATNWNEIKAHGLVRGAYQFYEPTVDPGYQADVVIAAVGQLGDGDLPVTLDVEWTSGTPNAAAIQVWVDRVTAGTGKIPMIYTAVGYWNQYFHGEFDNLDLWVANYGVSCPAIPNGWGGFRFWQPGGGPVPGIGGSVDLDVFNGTLEQLHRFASYGASDRCTNGAQLDCGGYACGCVDGACNGGACPGTGCTAEHTDACGNYGCGCVDSGCNGGFCPGPGCTLAEIAACGNYGCGCVDHQCGGGFCPGTGCTAGEIKACGNFGVNCVDHQCAGGFGPGSGCTAREALDCQHQGCGCADHACGGGSCAGTGCTARESLDCQAAGKACANAACVDAAPATDAGPTATDDAGAPAIPGDGGVPDNGGDAGTTVKPGHGCTAGGGGALPLPLLAAFVALRRRRARR
jgi:MYXO-CTERM domain-containing protein